ncbi:MAG: type II/IV secretion system protein [Deltaproteobacteria bacterium]|nr:type II/IV secretion system protein [Deltaproteobacteria bacterium]MBW1738078.1 type II/IV secretion system protein [Deltaproteobacteria bacterium]MBW1908688.1 type II/IV secretion system protein [Deltaproteobacteria bacterium]MBW2032485.1 type II/IV secretion system protein [Deltaproteobacteria bacterium]MBW2113348.1 type II/IV secretion system protein [Deltaproteobacteria bacterium]
MEIETKINEAEAYRSMGLLGESLAVFEQILSDTPELSESDRKTVNEKIMLLRNRIAELKEEAIEELSSKDLLLFREQLSSDKDVTAILDSAAAFRELGLFKNTISEYKKLFKLDYPFDEIIHPFVECLFKIHPASNIPEQIEKVIAEDNLKDKEKAQMKYLAGLEMEKMDNKDLALKLYESARKIDPKNDEINSKVDSLFTNISYKSRYDYLLKQKMVTTKQLRQALAMSKKAKRSVEYLLIEHFKIEKEEVGNSLSYFYGCPFRTYDPALPTPVELMGNLKKTFLLYEQWVPMSWGKEGVEILINDPRDLSKTDHIRALIKTKKINFSVAIQEDIEEFIKHFFDKKRTGEIAPEEDMIEDFDLIPDVSFEEEAEAEEQTEELDEASGQVVKLVDQALITAYRKNASDIHIEPSPVTKATTIRFRIDGVCQDYIKVPNSMARGILSRVKIMSNLDIAERRLPQDGKIKFKRRGVPPFELRVATLPTAGNFEDAVLRILAKAGAMKLEEMGLSDRNFQVMKQILDKPYGLVLVVGPTGSGKTTTLHSALGHINKPGIKIWTAEDPIEITQAGLRQVEAKPKIGLNFARIMRAFLRADPDVIMIGEMRDEETASIGIEASLTGHLVFSTLHTNSAPETVIRLLDMGLNPLNFSDAFLGVLAQRLVRRVCKKCREEYHPSREEFDEIVSDYGSDHFAATGIEYSSDLTLYRPGRGCETCSGTGYKGRLGIHELMEGTDEIKRMIKKQASSEMLFKQTVEEGMTTLKQDGIMKVFQGLTDVSEVRRVCIN